MKKILLLALLAFPLNAHAAMGVLPYHLQITSWQIQAGNTDATLTISIFDANNTTMASGIQMNVSPAASYEDFHSSLETLIFKQMLSDAGSKAAFLNAITGKNITLQ
jgi:hypothetical protein